jgi:hypothetical protein
MISGNTQCYHHVPLIILVVIAGTDKERPGCSKTPLNSRKFLIWGSGNFSAATHSLAIFSKTLQIINLCSILWFLYVKLTLLL